MARVKVVVIACLLSLAVAPSVWAQAADAKKQETKEETGDAGESSREELSPRKGTLADRIKSVQRKAFLKRNRHELGVNFGLTLNDTFFLNLAAGGSYTYHIMEAFALEANVRYYFGNFPSSAVRVVRLTQVATPAFDLTYPLLNADLEVQFAPIYGKMSVLGEKILHYDLYIGAGGGAAITSGTGVHPMGSVAIGSRLMTTDWLTIRIEVRDQIYSDTRTLGNLKESAIQNNILLSLGVSFFLPPSFDYRYE